MLIFEHLRGAKTPFQQKIWPLVQGKRESTPAFTDFQVIELPKLSEATEVSAQDSDVRVPVDGGEASIGSPGNTKRLFKSEWPKVVLQKMEIPETFIPRAEQIQPTNEEIRTRSGRLVRAPTRYDDCEKSEDVLIEE